MAFALDEYTAGAAATDFTITFSYLQESHVLVYKDGTLQTEGASNDYTFFNATTIRFNSGLTGGELIIIQRATSQSTRLTDYTAGALTEADLDNDSLQGFYMGQESVDIANRALGRSADGSKFDAETKIIENVVDPVAAQDAVTKNYADTKFAADVAAAAASAAAAATSETNAATSETNAATSYDNFDDRYLGQKTSAPTLDNDSNALLTGALYFNSVSNDMWIYNGSSWQRAARTDAEVLLSANNLSDVAVAATALSNLGGQPLDADLTAIAALGSTGIAVRSAADTWVQRTIVGGGDGITVTNGNGVSGNPSLSPTTGYNGHGVRTVSTSAASGGNNGDIWYKY